MNDFYKIDDLEPKSELQSVLKAIDCYEDSPVYEEMKEEYEEICDEVREMAEPVGILGFGMLPGKLATEEYKEGTPVVYAVISIGRRIEQQSTKAFQEGDYVRGMLCDAIADELLFSMEDRLIQKLEEVCGEHKKGILKRLEAPHDISMEAQKAAWEYLKLEKRFGIGISSGFMFDPVKTSCQIFVLTEDEQIFQARHDCRNCSNLTCKRRNIPETAVEVRTGEKIQKIRVNHQESLLEALIREGYYMSAPCGGKGRCGKCRVRLLTGNARISSEDRKFFTDKEIKEGWRLSCRIYPEMDLAIAFSSNDESKFEILGDEREYRAEAGEKEAGYEAAIDLGTTTIAIELLGKTSGKRLHTVTCINSQRAYGADVISRIQASVEGKKEELQKTIRQDLLKGLRKLTKEAGITLREIQKISIAGNTTMGHLLMGYDCSSLGVYPFTPVNIDFIRGGFEAILGSRESDAEVVILPGISTYVGGDIVSGIIDCGIAEKDGISLLVDLGTNGEMALGNRERILVTSTAAGPAFEGGNITWGTGSIAGAICSVEIHGKDVKVKTIQDQPPLGICGTGVVEAVSEMVKEEFIDETGLMDAGFFDDGFPLSKTASGQEIVLTAKDVREIQLAKAAIRAGAETLILRYGISKEQVSNVYLAGGFGYKLNKEKAVAIGMLPEEFLGKIEAVGNTSLQGAALYLSAEEQEEKIRRIIGISSEVDLSKDKKFNEFYMDHMMFGED